MTVVKHHPKALTTSSTSKVKLLPMKAAFRQAVKFGPRSSTTLVKAGTETGLQGDKRRRYMRRGSKTPAMLLLSSKLNLDAFKQDLSGASGNGIEHAPHENSVQDASLVHHFRGMSASSAFSACGDAESLKEFSGCEIDQMTQELHAELLRQPRRLSLMSTLQQNLENTSLSASTSSNPLGRRLSLDLLM